MTDIVTVLGSLLTLIVGFFLGQYAEKRKQSLLVRSEMLKPIEEWLNAIEKFNGIVGDTLTSVVIGNQAPIMY
ncbi:MAG: hypothetical protein M3R47_18685, partial [Chloroflexota bacterium]|nr:hypothetical protein [Chloroflexota bacterium]